MKLPLLIKGIPKMLLLVNSAPWTAGTGEQFLSALARQLPPGALCRYSTVQDYRPADDCSWLGFRSAVTRIPFSGLPVASSVASVSFSFRQRERLIQDVLRFSEEEKPEVIWAVLNAPIIYGLAHRVAGLLGLPLICGVWDPPEYLFQNLRLDPFFRSVFQDDFETCLRLSKRVAVVSEGMADEYSRKYGTHCTVIRSGIDRALWVEKPSREQSDEVVIGFSGSMYAKREWRALLRSIESAHGKIRGKKVKVRFVGRWPRFGVPSMSFVEHREPVSCAEAIRLMSEVDVCYLPYWLDRGHASTVRLSFPSKLSAYVAAGTPVLYHGPNDSTPTQFLEKYPVGVSCHSSQESALSSAIERCMWNPDFIEGYSVARSRVLEEELGLEAMSARFAGFLNLSVSHT